MNVRTPELIVSLFRRAARKEGAARKQVAAALIILVAALVMPAGASASAQVLHVRGQAANTELTMVDPADACIQTYVSLMPGESRVQDKGKPTTNTYASVVVFRDNICTGEYLTTLFGQASLPAGSFQADKKLNSASLIASFEVCDSYDPSICLPVDANLTWTGVGDVQHSKTVSHTGGSGCKSVFHSTGDSRSAQPAGTVTVAGTTGTVGAGDFGLLLSVKVGSIEINCP